jgi:hypothetical protein
MKNAIAILVYLGTTFALFYVLLIGTWHLFKYLGNPFPMEVIMPFLLLCSTILCNKAIYTIFLSSTFKTATISSVLHGLIVLFLAPGWYPPLHWATVAGCIASGIYVNYRDLIMGRESIHNDNLTPDVAKKCASS